VFHRVDDWTALGAPRFFAFTRLLVHYDGALRAALLRDHPPETAVTAAQEQPAGLDLYGELVDTVPPERLAAMSGGWIEHTGG
jgi:hypothetical protein